MRLYIGQTYMIGGWVSFSLMAPDIFEAEAFVKSIPDVSGTCVSRGLSSSDKAALKAHVAHVGRDNIPRWQRMG